MNKGVARGLQDIKGAIEVTRIVGPHQAEARITKWSIQEPMVAGDPIYTPLWRSGMTERFAIVGLIDLDNDGVSDRDVLNDLVQSAHGEITDWVDDQGQRHPANGNITVATKFLVIAKIPDFSTAKPNEVEAFKRIVDLKQKMVGEAMENGVRVISMEDFLNYMGYDAGRRIYRPGKSEKWNLRSGMEGTAARPDRNQRQESQGTTSGLFSGNRGQNARVGRYAHAGQSITRLERAARPAIGQPRRSAQIMPDQPVAATARSVRLGRSMLFGVNSAQAKRPANNARPSANPMKTKNVASSGTISTAAIAP